MRAYTYLNIRLTLESLRDIKDQIAAWRRVRGPKFSLNDMYVEKLLMRVEPTGWDAARVTPKPRSVPVDGDALPPLPPPPRVIREEVPVDVSEEPYNDPS